MYKGVWIRLQAIRILRLPYRSAILGIMVTDRTTPIKKNEPMNPILDLSTHASPSYSTQLWREVELEKSIVSVTFGLMQKSSGVQLYGMLVLVEVQR